MAWHRVFTTFSVAPWHGVQCFMTLEGDVMTWQRVFKTLSIAPWHGVQCFITMSGGAVAWWPGSHNVEGK
jgi:hypothetical protein